MYDFFTAKQYHKRLSRFFYGLFLLAIGVHALVILLLCWLFALVFTKDFLLSYWLLCLAGLLLYLLFGLAITHHQAKKGGERLAKHLKATRLFVSPAVTSPSYSDRAICVSHAGDLPSVYARFYEFATQMSIASGIALPKLYVLPFEQGINACVAGFDEQDRVLILTQGATEKLSNDGLYGLISHEFAHILHGDAKLNLRISVLLGALSWLYELSDWFDEVLFGGFHADYHRPTNKDGWLAHWQQTSSTNKTTQGDQLAAMLPAYVLLLVLRLVGLLGMATHEWIVSCFQRQRELLADATSVQLCRSFAIKDTLTTLQTHGSWLSGHQSRWSHSFFAQSHDGFFATHPSIETRLAMLSGRRFALFAKSATAHLDTQRLTLAQSKASAYQPVMTLDEEILAHTVAFEATHDQVIDGRLVVDQAFYDWGQKDDGGVSLFEGRRQVVEGDEPAELPWLVTKQLRYVTGCVAVIECVLLCRFAKSSTQIELGQIFGIATPCPVLAHDLDEALLEAIVKLPQAGDGQLIIKAIRALNHHLSCTNITPPKKALDTLERYKAGLLELLTNQSTKLQAVYFKDVQALNDNEQKFYQAFVLAKLCSTLGVQRDGRYLVALFSCFNLPALMLYRLLVLVFLAGLQDNSLLLGHTNARTCDIDRWCRLAGLPLLDQQSYGQLMHLSYGLTVADLAIILQQLNQHKEAMFCQTLHTVVLYGKQTANERDLMVFFDEFL